MILSELKIVKRQAIIMRRIKPFLFLFGLFCTWMAFSCSLFGVFRLWFPNGPEQAVPSSFLFPVSVLLFVLVGCQINTVYLVYVEKEFQGRPRIRTGCLLALLAISGLMYLAACHWLIKTPFFYMAQTANLIVFANLLGAWIIKPLRREAELIMVCLVMALADLFSIIQGPTQQLVKTIESYYRSNLSGPPPLVDFLLIKIPVAGWNHLQPLFGVSDWVIIVFLSAATVKFKINDNLTGRALFTMVADLRSAFYFPLAGVGLLAAIVTAHIFNQFIPVLPVIAVLFASTILIRYPAARRLTTSDWWLMAVFSGIMLTLLGLMLGLKRLIIS